MQSKVSLLRNSAVVHAPALFATVLMLVPSLAGRTGATYYVSTTGNDSNPGTIAEPWLTIQHAANTVTAGATVYVFGGVYNESVNFPQSGTASAPITFRELSRSDCGDRRDRRERIGHSGSHQYDEARATSLSADLKFAITPPSNEDNVPIGVWITGSGTGIQILNNRVHNITTTSEANGNAFGISVYGTSKTPITQLVISGNEVYDLKTGESESVNVDGNVTHFQITNNLVHDNDNIGIDAIGYEGVGPVGYDEAMYGEISGNTIYNISGITNPGEGYEYDADGLYCDGCAYVTIRAERDHTGRLRHRDHQRKSSLPGQWHRVVWRQYRIRNRGQRQVSVLRQVCHGAQQSLLQREFLR